MAKVLKCSDLNSDCSFEARGNTDGDVLKKVAEHAKTIHKMNKISLDVLDKARSAIRNEGKARTKGGFVERKEIIRGGDVDSWRKKWVPPSTSSLLRAVTHGMWKPLKISQPRGCV